MYAIKRESTVDATSMLKPYCTTDKAGFNYYSDLKSPKNLDIHKVMIENYLYNNHTYCKPEELLNQSIKTLQPRPEAYCSEYIERLSNVNDLNGTRELLNKYKEELKIDFTKNNKIPPVFDRYSQLYCILIRLYLNDLVTQQLYIPSGDFKKLLVFPPAPYLIYKVPIAFDRIKRQYGVFIYQGIVDFSTSLLPNDKGKQSYGVAVQSINADIEIKIENQNEIISDLDLIGINEKAIFGDYDTIASYVNRKTLKPINERAKRPFFDTGE